MIVFDSSGQDGRQVAGQLTERAYNRAEPLVSGEVSPETRKFVAGRLQIA